MQQVEKAKYLGVPFASYGRKNKEIDTLIGKTNSVLRELCHSPVKKFEDFKYAQLPGGKSVFVPILTCVHESWVITEKEALCLSSAGIFCEKFIL